MEATEQYFPVMLLIASYKVVLTLISVVQERLKYHHSNYSSLATAYCILNRAVLTLKEN